LPKATLCQHFKLLREAGLIRSERKGVEMHNTTRCAELKERFGDMLATILTTYRCPKIRAGEFRLLIERCYFSLSLWHFLAGCAQDRNRDSGGYYWGVESS
jgi:DNA-binding transcriptional ArsR family regulator